MGITMRVCKFLVLFGSVGLLLLSFTSVNCTEGKHGVSIRSTKTTTLDELLEMIRSLAATNDLPNKDTAAAGTSHVSTVGTKTHDATPEPTHAIKTETKSKENDGSNA